MRAARERETVRPDLVGDVAVRRDAVRAHDDAVHTAPRDQGRRRHVRKERDVEPVFAELPGREARPLQEGPRLVRENRDRTLGRERPDDSERGADPRRCESPRVAMREHRRNPGDPGPARREPGRAEAADREAREAILLGDAVGLGLEEEDPLSRVAAR